MNNIEDFLNGRLQQRRDNQSLRKLATQSYDSDFCSNDYLGFAKSQKLLHLTEKNLLQHSQLTNGSGGSRLLSGNTAFTEYVEQFVSDFHLAESGLIFNSGYDANVGLLSSVPQRGDTIITDELIHASIIDGCRLSHATRYKFSHNNLTDLEDKLKAAKGNVFVVVESIYSMDGDIAPLVAIAKLCQAYQANLIVDEAHATGIFGEYGRGLVNENNLENLVFARIVTFGKAMGIHGAIILGSDTLRDYLINFSRSFIYTTAAPIHNIAGILSAYEFLKQIDHQLIHQKIRLFRNLVIENKIQAMQSFSPIQGIVFDSNEKTKQAAQVLQDNGFDVRPILSPTVPVGKERLRICLHTYNTEEEIISLVNHLKKITFHG